MKRLLKGSLALVLGLLFLLSGALAADPRYDISSLDTRTNKDGSVRVLGISGEPRPIAWAAFSEALEEALADSGYHDLPPFGQPILSDGLSVRIRAIAPIFIRICTTSADAEGLVVEASVFTPLESGDEFAMHTKYITQALYTAAAQVKGSFGETMISLFRIDPALDLRDYDPNDRYWYQNGFDLFIGKERDAFVLGRVRYTGPYEKADGLSYDPLKAYPSVSSGEGGPKDIAGYIRDAKALLNRYGLGSPMPATPADGEGGLTRNYLLNQGIKLQFTMEDEQPGAAIAKLVVSGPPEVADYVFGAGLLSLYSLSSIPDEDRVAVAYVNGVNTFFHQFAELKPFAAYRGIALQLFAHEEQAEAVLFGAPGAD